MNEPVENRLLAIFAHPDDESFGTGGILAKFAHQGVDVILLSATCGEAGIPCVNPEQAGRFREAELRAAAKHLGATPYCLGYPDGKLADVDPNMLLEHIASWIFLVQPQVILTFGPDGVSGHTDHVTISRMVTRAYDQFYKNGVLLYIRPSDATVLGCGVGASSQDDGKPWVEVDISDYKLAKVQAIQSHSSQSLNLPGTPEEAIDQIPCHETYTIARENKFQGEIIDWFPFQTEKEV